jgi:hypothetical protein
MFRKILLTIAFVSIQAYLPELMKAKGVEVVNHNVATAENATDISATSGTCSCQQYGGGTCSGFCSGSSCPCMNCQTWTQLC